MNDLGAYANVFDGITPFSGMVPSGFLVNFLGGLTDAGFRTIWGVDPAAEGGRVIDTELPVGVGGESWFEMVNCVEAAREARGRYVMMTLGACYGGQAVDAYKTLQAVNPMPATLVAVEGVPENVAWVRKNFRDNGIDPDAHWIVEAAMSASNEPVIFPVGSPGSGAQNCISTNSNQARETLVQQVIESGNAEKVVRNLLLGNTTGVQINLTPDYEQAFMAELRYVSAITLNDLLGPFDRVDYVEADLQQSEAVVFPPAMAQLSAKVRRVHLGTHGADVHHHMHALFQQHGWEVLFSYEPNSHHDTPQGSFDLNDGVLSAVNSRVAYR